MEKIQFDSGVRTYRVNGGQKLCFNPAIIIIDDDPHQKSEYWQNNHTVDRLNYTCVFAHSYLLRDTLL